MKGRDTPGSPFKPNCLKNPRMPIKTWVTTQATEPLLMWPRTFPIYKRWEEGHNGDRRTMRVILLDL